MGKCKMFIVCICFAMLILSGCVISSNTNTNSDSNNASKDYKKINTFDVDSQTILGLFEETGKYIETQEYNFKNNEKSTAGTIRLDTKDYDNLFSEENIYTQLRTFEDKVFSVSLIYDVSGDEKYYNKFPELAKKVLTTVKPNIDTNFLGEFDNSTNDYYYKDIDNLRYYISYKEWGLKETRIEIGIVNIDNNSDDETID